MSDFIQYSFHHLNQNEKEMIKNQTIAHFNNMSQHVHSSIRHLKVHIDVSKHNKEGDHHIYDISINVMGHLHGQHQTFHHEKEGFDLESCLHESLSSLNEGIRRALDRDHLERAVFKNKRTFGA